ncbi:ABC transporter permease [Georgenia faecalis]|uniref:ABC transporter permease n=1 Tax=Georgenia faecalis TaxID=2483799 RepID=A0ABV9D6K1_9MICO|nr:ABC transporter permease [Georgenia faecalis]
MTRIRAALAVVVRNLRIAGRRADLVVQAVAVPVVVLGLASIIFGASDAWPVGVVDESDTPQSRMVVRALEDTRGATGPYFRSITDDQEHAERLLHEGRLHLVVTIPDDFPVHHQIETSTYNINTDAMKNVRLRVTTAANLHDQLTAADGVTAYLDKARAQDVSRTAFMGGSAVVLALLLGAALLSANLYALESEHRTRKEIALSPLGASQAATGAALAGWLLSFLAAVPTALLALAFGTRATLPDLAQTLLIVLPAGLVAAGLGVLIAVGLRTHRLIQPTLILLALGSYFAGGGFIPVPALPPLARTIAAGWPPSYVFEWANPVLHGFRDAPSAVALAGAGLAAVAALAAAMGAARRDYRTAAAPGQ